MVFFCSFFFHYSTHFLSCLLLFHFYSLHFTSLLFSSSLFFPLLLTSILLCSFRLFPSLRLLCPHLSFRQCYALSSSPLLSSPLRTSLIFLTCRMASLPAATGHIHRALRRMQHRYSQAILKRRG